ncbi:MAG TPA: class I SAM-dependent methyltransferase [Solirubrobacteraceae bacterium]|nr:class I SAM-dependent methyltransferase [Solirubrobacteraceae bacterium]
MSPLPTVLRSRTPTAIKDHPGVRAAALAAGLIPPRPMHTRAEADTLRRYAAGARCVVELGVYEGSSAVVFCDVLGPDAELHLVDPFTDETGAAMRAGWHGTPFATRRAVRRYARGGPRIHWHVARSQDVGGTWAGPHPDLVFIDGDHSPQGCGEDWRVWHPHVRAGGAVAFHDARFGRHEGSSSPGPTQVVDALRSEMPAGWRVGAEVDSLVVLERSADV